MFYNDTRHDKNNELELSVNKHFIHALVEDMAICKYPLTKVYTYNTICRKKAMGLMGRPGTMWGQDQENDKGKWYFCTLLYLITT